jgi:transposase
MARLEALRSFAGTPLPQNALAELRRLLARHRVVSDQLKEIEAERDRVMTRAAADREERKIQRLAQLYGLGVETASGLVREMLCRRFRDRRAVAAYPGLTGTPFNSGGTEREQGLARSGNARVRRLMIQLAWRWLWFQPQSALSRWFVARTAGARGRMRKIMIGALARKLLIALWRYVETGELPAGARIA